MPHFSASVDLPQSAQVIFAFFLRPANILAMKPADLHLELIEGPDIVEAGSRVTWKVRRWGVAQRFVHEVIEMVPNERLVEKQIQGPFPQWLHTRRFETLGPGTRLTDEIAFEPPTGILGRLVTAEKVLGELGEAFAERERWLRLRELDPGD